MNSRGFTLIELLACLALLGVILGIGLFVTRDTLSTSLTSLTDVSERELYDTAEIYVLENNVSWISSTSEYACVTVNNLVEKGYFKDNEVSSYKGKTIKVIREETTKTISDVRFVEVCE